MASMRSAILVSGFLLVFIQCVSSNNEPCTNYKSIDNPKRNPEYRLARGERAICDSSLTLGWYRFTNAERAQIPTTKPRKRQCGTVAAIWMNGRHPTTKGDEVEATACTNIDNRLKGCMFPRQILVKNCGDYYVYYLQPTEGRCEAYCAGSPEKPRLDLHRNRRSALSSNCSSKNNTCLINGQCFSAKGANPMNWCQQCMPDVKKDSWTQRQDNRQPTFSMVTSLRYAVTGENLPIQLKATDPDNRPLSYSLIKSDATSGATFTGSTGLLQYQVKSQQNTSFTFQVKDECNATDTVTITVTLMTCPCQNGGKCSPKQPRGSGQYTCGCLAGYNGTRCEIQICSSQSCFTGVKCTNIPTGISCGLCPAGFTGDGITCQALTTTAAPATTAAATTGPITTVMVKSTSATTVAPIPPATSQATTVAQTTGPPLQTTTGVPTTAAPTTMQTTASDLLTSGAPSTTSPTMQTTAAPHNATSVAPTTSAVTTVQTTAPPKVNTTELPSTSVPTTMQTTTAPIVSTSGVPPTAAPTTMQTTTPPTVSTTGAPSTTAVPTTAQATQQPTTKATTGVPTTVIIPPVTTAIPTTMMQTTTEISTTEDLTTKQTYETTKEPVVTEQPEPTTTTTEEIPTEFLYVKNAEIELNQEWNDDYSNNNSKAYKDLQYLLEEKILRVYIAAGDNIAKVTVTGFSKGSVIAKFELAFKTDSSDSLKSLREAIKNGTLGDFIVKPDSLRIQEEGQIEAKTEPKGTDSVALVVVLVVIGVLIVVAVAVALFLRRRKKRKMSVTKQRSVDGTQGEMLPLTERDNK